MRTAPPSCTSRPYRNTSGLLVPALLSHNVLVAPGGALRVNFWIAKLVAGVSALRVMVLLLPLVMRANALMSGAGGLTNVPVMPSQVDQFVRSLHKPSPGPAQIFSAGACGAN